ncbi:YheC/YheD family protein [Bacillus aquiflavi]|uniref:YheC/YheD family endospore coat-associated protein n=1 Tax=Bacillus aquiflavi TaxID=2672567 RepID=UPI001CA8A0A4|nr:YheC/YheD family protein [Bacillus aquiflavi]UAC48956.1 YheC/YheD family protein [Bacillus aquiflavi]
MTASFLSITIHPCEVFHDHSYFIRLSTALFHKWKLSENDLLHLIVEKASVRVSVASFESEENMIEIPNNLLAKLFLPARTICLGAKFIAAEKTVYFGPIITLLTEINEELDQVHFYTVHDFCYELHKYASKLNCFFYVCSLQNITNRTLNGYFYENEKWHNSCLPIPNVVYNRIHSRRRELSKMFCSFQAQLKNYNIPFFNYKFLSKWEVHKQLMIEKKLHRFLPETNILTKGNFTKKITCYDLLFIKPLHGSQGKDIVRIKKKGNNLAVQLSTTSVEENEQSFKDIEHFYQYFTSQLKKQAYIVQQGIYLITANNRPLDFRLLCQKRNMHTWTVTSIVARLSANHQFVSNISQGGEIVKPFSVLLTHFHFHKALQIFSHMKELAIEAASVMSNQHEGVIGELGIDIGVDINGGLWMIEINSKPSKKYPNHKANIRPSAKGIINYAKVLALSNGGSENSC